MDIAITGRNIELDDEIKRYVHKRFDKAERLYQRIYRCEVVLEQEKDRLNAEAVIYLKNNKLVAKESSQDLFASIDMAANKTMKQLRRLRGKLQAKRRRTMVRGILKPVSVLTGRKADPVVDNVGKIINVEGFADKPLIPEEARLELDVKGFDFLMFRNSGTNEVNVLYRRNNGTYGLIEPRF